MTTICTVKVSPSLYYVVGTPLIILLHPFGGWELVYCGHGKWEPCFNERRASFELAVRDASRVLEATRSAAMLALPHPASETIGDVPVYTSGLPNLDAGAVTIRTLAQVQPTGTLLPALVDEESMTDCVATQIAAMRPRFEKEFSLEFLATELRKGLREGRLTLVNHAVYAADAGDELADAALRTVYAEMAGGVLSERGPGHLQVWAYGQRAVLRAPAKRPAGHCWQHNWMRDIWICDVIFSVWHTWGIRQTRNRYARGRPSAVSIVTAALGRAKVVHLDEGRVQNIWLGLPGEIVRSARGGCPS
jgi:hypothetical protein